MQEGLANFQLPIPGLLVSLEISEFIRGSGFQVVLGWGLAVASMEAFKSEAWFLRRGVILRTRLRRRLQKAATASRAPEPQPLRSISRLAA